MPGTNENSLRTGINPWLQGKGLATQKSSVPDLCLPIFRLSARKSTPRINTVIAPETADSPMHLDFKSPEMKCEAKSEEEETGSRNRPALKLTRLEQISVSKELRCSDVLGAEGMSRAEWAELKNDPTIMRKAQGLNTSRNFTRRAIALPRMLTARWRQLWLYLV